MCWHLCKQWFSFFYRQWKWQILCCSGNSCCSSPPSYVSAGIVRLPTQPHVAFLKSWQQECAQWECRQQQYRASIVPTCIHYQWHLHLPKFHPPSKDISYECVYIGSLHPNKETSNKLGNTKELHLNASSVAVGTTAARFKMAAPRTSLWLTCCEPEVWTLWAQWTKVHLNTRTEI